MLSVLRFLDGLALVEILLPFFLVALHRRRFRRVARERPRRGWTEGCESAPRVSGRPVLRERERPDRRRVCTASSLDVQAVVITTKTTAGAWSGHLEGRRCGVCDWPCGTKLHPVNRSLLFPSRRFIQLPDMIWRLGPVSFHPMARDGFISAMQTRRRPYLWLDMLENGRHGTWQDDAGRYSDADQHDRRYGV